MSHLSFRSILLAVVGCSVSCAGAANAIAAPSAPSRSSPAASDGGGLRALTGSWKVVAVQVEDSDVQALVKNDPSYMGAVLRIVGDRLSWAPHKGGELSDVCDKARITPGGEIACGSGEFGPSGTKLTVKSGTMRLEWYDGGILMLKKMR